MLLAGCHWPILFPRAPGRYFSAGRSLMRIADPAFPDRPSEENPVHASFIDSLPFQISTRLMAFAICGAAVFCSTGRSRAESAR